MPSPIPHQGRGNDVRFELSDSKAPESVESLLLDSEFLQNRMQVATKEIRLMHGNSFFGLEGETFFAVADVSLYQFRDRGLLIHASTR